MYRFKFIIILSVFVLCVEAQSVNDYIHSTSNQYILGNMKEAKNIVMEGLRKFPSSPELQELAAKIKDDEQKNQNKNQEQNQDQDQQNKDQQNQDQQKQDEKKNQQKGQQDQQISKQDAERLLEALEQDEKNVMQKVQEQKAKVRKIPVEKEW